MSKLGDKHIHVKKVQYIKLTPSYYFISGVDETGLSQC